MIKFRSLTNPAHIKSILGERAYRRVRASGVAFDLSDAGAQLRTAKHVHTMHELVKQHVKEHNAVWAKEHEEDLAKYSKLLRAKAPSHVFTKFDLERLGGRGERDRRTILAITILSKWNDIVHTKWYVDEGDTAHRYLLPVVMAEFNHYLTCKWYEMLAKQSGTFLTDDSYVLKDYNAHRQTKKTGGAGFIFRRARALPRLRQKVLAWFGTPLTPAEFDTTESLIHPERAEVLCDNEQRCTRTDYKVGDYGSLELVLQPRWESKSKNGWDYGATLDIEAHIDIRDERGRALARKIASLISEANKEVGV